MKKIGIIVALALIVTIAGAYATWTYTTSASVDPVTVNTSTIGLTAYTEQTADGGTITVDTSHLFIYVDGDSNHNAKLVFSSVDNKDTPDENGYIVVTYTPKDANDAQGLVLTCTATAPTNTYNGQAIFDQTASSITSDHEVGEDESGTYAKWTISGSDLATLIKLKGTVTADTLNDYNDLSTALSGATYSITVGAASDATN